MGFKLRTLLLHSQMLHHLTYLLCFNIKGFLLKVTGLQKKPSEGFKLGSFRSVDWCCTTRSKSLLRKANNRQKSGRKYILKSFCSSAKDFHFSFLLYFFLSEGERKKKKGNFSQKFFFLSSSRKRKRPLSLFFKRKNVSFSCSGVVRYSGKQQRLLNECFTNV